MFKVEIENTKDGRRFLGIFPNNEEILKWVKDQEAVRSWGRPERWVYETQPGVVPDENIAESVERLEEIENPGDEIPSIKVRHRFLPDYTITITDITSEEDAKKAALAAIEAAKESLKATKPVMTLLELSDAINKILLILGIK